MKKIVEAMALSPLFRGLTPAELKELALQLVPGIRQFERGETVIRCGERAKGIGLVLSGRLHIVRDDFLGNRESLAEVEKGDIFDEVFAILYEEPQSISAEAVQPSEVARLPRDEAIVLIAGANPLRDRKFDIEDHRRWREVYPGHSGASHRLPFDYSEYMERRDA